jgi:hypothetical protein
MAHTHHDGSVCRFHADWASRAVEFVVGTMPVGINKEKVDNMRALLGSDKNMK